MKGVAITGVGLVSALGIGEEAHLEALKRGRSGLRPLALFAAEGIAASPVGEVETLDPQWGRWGRTASLALTAAGAALSSFETDAAGVMAVGTTTGGIFESEQHYLRHRGAETDVDRELLRHHAAGGVVDHLATTFGLRGERHTFSTACSSSANAIGYAALRVAGGAAWALAGGTDSLCRLTYAGFHSLKLLSPAACQPFDQARRGLSLGEAAAFFLLEPLERARARGANVLGFVAGWGASADAHHMTAPHPEGRGAREAIRLALADAGVQPDEIDYVNAHGTATPANDRAEALALHGVFGQRIPQVSSTKGSTGHTLGAAGALEAALCLLAIRHAFAPATVGLIDPDPELALPHVPPGGVSGPIRNALSNSFGFGGNNTALVLRGESG